MIHIVGGTGRLSMEGAEGPLLGRSAEQSAAHGALGVGRAGVAFVGPRGVGKTSLLRSLAHDLSAGDHCEVVRIFGSATEPPIPFGAFAPVAPDIGSGQGRQPDSLHLLQAFRAELSRRARGGRIVLAVDDAHRLDSHSALLVFQLVAAGTVSLVMSLCSAARVPSGVRSLWKEELVERIEVGPLSRDSTEQLMARLLSGYGDDRNGAREGGLTGPTATTVGGDMSETIWQVSQGNPLYARELVRWGFEAGWIRLRDGVWRLSGELTVGPRLVELIGERLQPLSEAEHDALELVALADPLPLRMLMRLAGSEPVESLEKEDLLSCDVSGRERLVRPGHPVVGEVARASMPAPRLAVTAHRLAEAFEAEGRTETDLLRVVGWRLDGGDDPDPDLLVRASLRAAELQEWSLSARLAEAAVARGGDCEAMLALAEAYRALGRYAEALAVLVDQRAGGDDQVARAAILRASILYFGFGRLQEALDGLRDADARVQDRSDRTWLAAMAAGVIGFSGRPAESVELASKLAGEPFLRPRAETAVKAVLSLGLSWTGRTDSALAILDGALARREPLADLPVWELTARTVAHRLSGRIDSLESTARSSYQLGVHLHDPRLLGPAAAALGWASLGRAHLSAAVTWFREAAVAMQAAGGVGLRIPALLGLSEALTLVGDLEGAESALEEARPGMESRRLPMPEWSVTAAWLAAAQGATSEALERLERTASSARAWGQTSAEMQALQAAVRLGDGASAARLAELASWVEGPLVAILADHAAALRRADGPGDGLDAVSSRYAGLGLNLFAAEAAAQAYRAHRSAGSTRKAAASSARGHALLGSRDGDPAPLGLALALAPPQLTPREREVAMLAAGGLPSQAIANRLHLSVRTVETHLARVYLKLGIGGRTELPPALAPPGDTWPVQAG